MGKINMGKVITGGLAAGLVLNVVDYLVNGVFLAAQWTEASKKLNTGVDAMGGSAIATYVGGDFILGILIVWLYAAIRPRFGAGSGTAMKAALAVWVTSALFGTEMAMLGVYPSNLVMMTALGTLVGMVAAGYVGGMMYKE